MFLLGVTLVTRRPHSPKWLDSWCGRELVEELLCIWMLCGWAGKAREWERAGERGNRNGEMFSVTPLAILGPQPSPLAWRNKGFPCRRKLWKFPYRKKVHQEGKLLREEMLRDRLLFLRAVIQESCNWNCICQTCKFSWQVLATGF